MTEVGSALENLSRHERALLFERLRQKREQQDRGAERIGRRAPGTEPLPLSFAQQRLWFLDRLEPGNSAYNIPTAVRLTGVLDAEALHQAILGVAVRHESLRTTFGQVGDEPVQVIAPRPDIPMPMADLASLGERAEAEAVRICAERSREPFDLARGPLVRALLVRLGSEEHVLLLAMHHVVSDGWSMGVLVRETTLLYSALAAGEAPVLPPLPIQYADFALWQREWLQGERLEKQLAWWRERLEPLPEPLQLPTDRPRPLHRSSRGDHVPFRIPAEVVAGLKEVARQEGGTLFVGLLAGFQALLQRYTGQDDIPVGTPVANRNRAETADLIGFFVNTLVLRGDLSGDPTFRELLGRLREVSVNAFGHQDLPFERLVEELRPDRDPSRTPLFEVMLALQNTPAPAMAEGGLRLEAVEFETSTAQFDLQLLTVETQGEIAGLIEYSTDLFDRATLVRCATHLEALFAGAVENPARRLSRLPLLTAGEQQQAVLEWNDTAARYSEDGGLHGLVEAQVDRTPDAVAVTFEGESLTYRELDRAANRLARRLRRRGAGPDSRVAVCLDRSLEMVVSVLAVLKAGGAYVPVDPGSPPERLAAILEDSGAGLGVTLQRHLEAIPPGPRWVVLDDPALRLAEEKSERLGIDPGPDAASYVIYTSGSTGRPKGVVNTHRGIRNRLLWIQSARGLTPADRVIQKTPFTFDVSVWEFFWTLMAGARLVIARPGGHRDPAYLVQLIAEEGVTVVHFVPSMLQAFLEEPDLALRIPTVRQVILGGEALTPELRQRALTRLPPYVELFNQYGPTEAAIEVTAWDVRQDTGMRVPIGRPVANTRIHLLDRSLRPVPLGVAGELYVGGPQLARGYEGRPDLTAERFVPDPISERPGERLYRTGDLARRLPDGAVEYLGRLDFQVKIRGFRIELGEIETALASIPGVREAAVLAPEERPGERRLAAYLVPADGALDLAAVRDLLRRKVPEPMVPSSWTVLRALPLNASGKLDRRALAALPAEGIAYAAREEPSGTPLRTPVEELLAGIWAEVLDLDPAGRPISPRDNFFELGGHSLLATRLVSRLRETFGVEVPLHEIFALPVLEDLARRIEVERAAGGTAAAPEIRPVPRDRDLPLSFAQERLWFLDRLEPGRSVYNMPIALVGRGGLDPAALEAALREVVRRHENLRTTFAEREGRPVQVIAPPFPWTLPRVDLSGLAGEAAHAEARRLADEDATRPFDLAQGPLLRAHLLALGPAEHVLLLDMHHIVSDGWSLGVLVNEITALYQAAVQGEPSPLPELPVQYADFAVWQREWLQEEALNRQMSYWKARLADAPASLDLPTDRPRPPVQSFRGATIPFSFGPELTRDLRALGRRQGATLFMTLLAAFVVLLRRVTGQDDLVVGTPIAGRNQLATEPLIGFFVNSLVLRLDAAGDPDFGELLARVRGVALDAYAHQDLPFERLVEELGPERLLSHNPLFQVMFALQNAPVRPVELPGLSLAPLDFEIPYAKFDLGPTFQEVGESLAAALDYAADLFDPATIRRMAGHLETILAAVVAHPGSRVSELPLLAGAERHQLLAEWNDTAPDRPAEDVVARFEAQVARSPETPAVEAGEDRLTYAELNDCANLLAGHLRSLGVGPGTVVGLCVDRTLDLAVGLLGIWKAGGAYLPLDPALPQARLAFLLKDSGASLVVGHQATVSVLGVLGVPWVLVEDSKDSQDEETTAVRPTDLAYMIYTSGTTGQPKAVMVERGHLAATLEASRGFFAPGDRMPCLAPFSFDIFLFELLGPLLAGGTSILVPLKPALDVDRLVADLGEATLLHAVPALMRQIVDRIPNGSRTALRGLFVGGDVVPAELLADLRAAFPQVWVRVLYGPTEATIICTAHEVGEGARSLLGRPLAGANLVLRDQAGELVPVGVPGEIWIGGEGVTRGYWRREELTAEKFVERDDRRFFRTGDLARLLPDGTLEFLGRIDSQVKIRGFRIELGEVESALARHPGVREAVAVAREDDPAGKRLVAYVVPGPPSETGPESAGHVQQWQSLYEETYGRSAAADPRFNLEGWNSSYTGEPIPEAEMREWLESTVERILSLNPRRVLEIGCGTGLILYRVAPQVERYVGTDFSQTALDSIRREIDRSADLGRVELVQRTADDWSGIEPGDFDLVILNSVVQYFPGVEYLRRVLEGAVATVAPTGGAVFVGDVRNLALLEELHASVERFRNPDLPEEELLSRVRRRVAEEEELLLDPQLFAVLPGRLPGLRSAEVLPKRATVVNELTRFRYDVVLRVGEAEPPAEGLDWTAYANDPLKVRSARSLVADLRRSLQAELPEYMVPSAFMVLDSLPLTAHGKVDRAALPAPEIVRPAAAGSYAAPRTPAEEALAAIWAEVLGLERVGIEDNFFELGGHSLLATQVVSQVRERLGAELPVRALFEHPTIAGLAPQIEAENAGIPETLLVRRPPGMDVLPLSFAQQRFWFLDRLEPGNPAYTIASPVRITGPLDAETLRQALEAVADRHESLRTTFREEGGRPVQMVGPRRRLDLPVVDLTSAGGDEASLRRLCTEEARRPFDLAAGPLVRATLLRLGPESHVLMLAMHHIVSDGWSMGILVREAAALYEARAEGSPASLPELPVQYGDFALWQREWLAGQRLEAQLTWWRERLQGLPDGLDLPVDRPRPPRRSSRGGHLPFSQDAGLTGRLRDLARQEGATLFMVLLAGFEALLQRYTGQDDLAIGSPIANRNRAETVGLIGFFVNTLVLRGDLAGDPPFRVLVTRLREVTLGAYDHQDLPFERLVEELRPERDPSRTPLFQALFALQNAPVPEIDAAGLRLEGVEHDLGATQFDLSLFLQEDRDGALVGSLEYGADLFDPATVARMARHFEVLLRAVAADPDVRLSRLPLLTRMELHHLAVEWNDTGLPETEASVVDLFRAQAARTPDAVAVSAGGAGERSLTYAMLDRLSDRAAHRLLRLGLGPETVVGVLAERSAGLVTALLGILKAGGAYLPLDPGSPGERLAWMLADAGASLLLADRGLSVPGIRTVFLDDLVESEDDGGEIALPAVPAGVLAYVMYTSGSTGRPKGVAVTHRNVVRLLRGGCAALGQTFLQLTPVFFDPSTLETWGPLVHGGCVAPFPGRRPTVEEISGAIARHGATSLWLTTGLFHQMAEHGLAGLRPLSQLLAGGDVLSPAHVRRTLEALPGLTLVNGYGPTEVTTFTTCHVMTEPAQAVTPLGTVPIGRPIGETRVHLLDRALRPVPVGVAGDLYAGGGGVARGYLGRPALTAERFLPDPFSAEPGARLYRTGDLARHLPDGRIEFLGRTDDQVKIRGFRIEMGEIEAALAEHPEVEQAAVLAQPEASGGKRLVGCVVPRPEAGEDLPERLRSHLRQRLPEPMVPSVWLTLPALPLTLNGKVDRRTLAARVDAAPRSTADWVAPRDPSEEVLAGLWRQVLQVERVGVHDNFFELGGHSLLAVQLVSLVRAAFGVELPLAALFEAPALGELAEVIAAQGGKPSREEIARLRLAGEGREAPLSFSQERLWFLERLMPGTSAYNIPGPLRLKGSLDAGVLESCFAELFRRHESLRTRFSDRGGVPVQVIAPPMPRPLPRVDLSALPIEAGRRESERLTAEEALWPFDLERGPLFRPILLRLAPEEHVLLLTIHHIVSDGWSMGVLFRELLALYGAFAAGQPSPLPDLPLQYADYAVWQREKLSGPELQAQLGYWRARLAGHPPALELPLDRPRPPVQTFRGASVTVELPVDVSARLKSLSLAEHASPFMALLAAFKLLLARLAGQEDVLVGIPIAGRSRSELEGLIGFFLNTLVLRTDVSGDATFRELMQRVRETALGAYGHQDVPFERLLEDLQPERDLSRTPLFQVFFNMLNFPRQRTELPGGVSIEPLGWGEAEAKFDITVYALEGAGGAFVFSLVYNADLFDRARMEELARQYAFVLERAAARPDEAMGTVSLRTVEAASLLPDPQEPLGSEWMGAVHDLFLARARQHPERIAVEDAEVSWTYSELAERVERLAAALQEAGVGKGDRVAIYAHRSAPVAWAVLATLRAGGVFVMLDPAYPAPRLAEMLQLAQPRAFIALEAAGEVSVEIGSIARLTLPCDLETLPERAAPVEVGPDDIAYIAFTSGSTGVPKGILGRHGPLSHFLPWQCQRFGLTEEDRYSLLSGLAHDPLQRDLFTPLCTGGAVCVPTMEEIATPGRLAHWMARRGITVAHLTPAMGQILTETVAEPARVDSLRWVLLVGDVLTRLDVDRLRRIAPQVQVVNLYGSTETQRAVGYHVVEDEGAAHERSRQVLPLGRGMKDVQLLVVNAAGALAGVGEVGEIQVRSPHLAAGYLGDPELTRERFRDGVYRTGDLGRYLPNGEAAFAGRADLQVKIRGFRIELGEIEATLGRLPGVREAVVIARQDGGPTAERRLVAYVVPDPQAKPAAEELREGLRQQLPAYMVPSAFVLLPKLPVTPNNKVDRRALPAPDLEAESAASYVEPQSELEQTLAGVWAEVLGLEKVGVTQNFFDLGGHSLLLVRLHARLQEALGRELTLVELFNYPNVRALAEHLSRSAAPAAAPAAQPQDRAKKQIEAARRQKELARARRGGNRGEGS